MNQSDNTGVSPCARRFLRFRSTAALLVRAIAFAAAILFSFGASYVHAQETFLNSVITITSPTDTVMFAPGDTFSIEIGLGPETAALLVSEPTAQRLTANISLSRSFLSIEAVAPFGTDTSLVGGGIQIGLPRDAYDSVAGGEGLGGITTADGLRIEVADLIGVPTAAFFVFSDDRDAQNGSHFEDGTIFVAPPGSGSDLRNSFGSLHRTRFSPDTGNNIVTQRAPSLEQLTQYIRAHEISITPEYSGGSFLLRLTLVEGSSGGADGLRDTVTAEVLVRVGAEGLPVGPRSRCPPSPS